MVKDKRQKSQDKSPSTTYNSTFIFLLLSFVFGLKYKYPSLNKAGRRDLSELKRCR
jgi:hypothetical protein